MTAGQLLAASASYRQNLVRANNLVFPYFFVQFAHNPTTKAMGGGGGYCLVCADGRALYGIVRLALLHCPFHITLIR